MHQGTMGSERMKTCSRRLSVCELILLMKGQSVRTGLLWINHQNGHRNWRWHECWAIWTWLCQCHGEWWDIWWIKMRLMENEEIWESTKREKHGIWEEFQFRCHRFYWRLCAHWNHQRASKMCSWVACKALTGAEPTRTHRYDPRVSYWLCIK